MSLSPGTRLGHYDVTALLGEGGMGQVWENRLGLAAPAKVSGASYCGPSLNQHDCSGKRTLGPRTGAAAFQQT